MNFYKPYFLDHLFLTFMCICACMHACVFVNISVFTNSDIHRRKLLAIGDAINQFEHGAVI